MGPIFCRGQPDAKSQFSASWLASIFGQMALGFIGFAIKQTETNITSYGVYSGSSMILNKLPKALGLGGRVANDQHKLEFHKKPRCRANHCYPTRGRAHGNTKSAKWEFVTKIWAALRITQVRLRPPPSQGGVNPCAAARLILLNSMNRKL
jgi:hypothetical protein